MCSLVDNRRTRTHYQLTRLVTYGSTYNRLVNSFKNILAKHKSDPLEQKQNKLFSVDGNLWREAKNFFQYKDNHLIP